MLSILRRAAQTAGIGIAVPLVAVSSLAHALPERGAIAPRSARVEDVDEKKLAVADLVGRPALFVYEDKGSRGTNTELKQELAKLVKEEPGLAKVRVVAVADVSEYDFWPAKGAARDAIREEQKKEGTTIWLDWTGEFRSALDLARGSSNVLLLDGAGRVTFVAAGKLAPATRSKLYADLRAVAK